MISKITRPSRSYLGRRHVGSDGFAWLACKKIKKKLMLAGTHALRPEWHASCTRFCFLQLVRCTTGTELSFCRPLWLWERAVISRPSGLSLPFHSILSSAFGLGLSGAIYDRKPVLLAPPSHAPPPSQAPPPSRTSPPLLIANFRVADIPLPLPVQLGLRSSELSLLAPLTSRPLVPPLSPYAVFVYREHRVGSMPFIGEKGNIRA